MSKNSERRAKYELVYLQKSDGKLETINKKKRKEANAPTASQLDQTPDSKGVIDYYRLVEIGDDKEVEWRRKLGGMLKREIGEAEHRDQNWIIAHMPENYRLYEHVRFTKSDETGEAIKSSNTHAKGHNDRQDAYLYGHPLGRKKRYRSPADFFHHLLWLVMDDSSDPDNCTCKICAPDDIQCPDLFPELLKETNKEPLKKEAVTASSPAKAQSSAGANPMVVVPVHPNAQGKQTKSPAQAGKATQAPAINAPARGTTPMLVQTPLEAAKSEEQKADAQYGKFVFRLGETVWFNKDPAWGLSVIINRGIFKDSQGRERARYQVQPLSYPFEHQESQIRTDDNLRPWLAWSAPPPYHMGLRQKGFHYANIDWRAVVEGKFGDGDPEVDGSIFAARAIDESITLLGLLSSNNQIVTTGERLYNGVYFGGEKFWVGDPVRLRSTQGPDLMVVHRIVERLKNNSTSTASATISVVGDIYLFTTVPYNPSSVQPSMTHLPLRMRREIDFQNRILQSFHKTTICKLTQTQSRIPIVDVKGRWYEPSTLLPILEGMDVFHDNLRHGIIRDTGPMMNARLQEGHTLAAGQAGKRFLSREETLGAAVPKGTKVANPSEALPFVEQEPPLAGEGSQGGAQVQGQGQVDEMAQFMNLEGIGDSMGESAYGGQIWGDGQQ
ncbi:MAG: hypothetical protein Q9191_005303 [Dirinaria sp. TL-2023a]